MAVVSIQVIEICSEVLQVRMSEVNLGLEIFQEKKFDEILGEVEEELGIAIEDDEIEEVRTVQDLIDLAEQKVTEKETEGEHGRDETRRE